MLVVLIGGAMFLVPSSAGSEEKRDPGFYVSLLQLLTNPDRFAGQVVIVTGYLDYVGHPRLYLTRDHALVMDHQTSIMVSYITDVTQDACMKHYVRVKGTFKRLDEYSYGLIDVESIRDQEKFKTCWRALDAPSDE